MYSAISILFRKTTAKKQTGKLTAIAANLFRSLVQDNVLVSIKNKDPKLFKYMDTQYKKASKKRKEELLQNHINNMKVRYDGAIGIDLAPAGDQAQSVRIGTLIIDCVIASGVNLFEVRRLKNPGSGSVYIVKLTQECRELLSKTHQHLINSLIAHTPPMVFTPRPWATNNLGGLYTVDYPIMKMRVKEGFNELRKQPLDKVYPILNKLQDRAWKINTFVLDTIQHIFDREILDPKSPHKIERLYGSLPTATPREAKDLIIKQSYGSLEEDGTFTHVANFKRWRMDYEQITIALDSEVGRRIQLIAALAEAQEYRKYSKIWFAYNLDSRGRVYTLQTLVTPQSSSTIKALLMFSDARHLDEAGIHWFKIHTANVYGKDKEGYTGRIKWFDENIAIIRKVGKKPLETLEHWSYCDSPFEFLAACNEWVKHEAGEAVSVPIQLDATNSGVQIYSGLLGDEAGAKTVNVVNHIVDGEIVRADVYKLVADRVNESLLSKKYPKSFSVTLSDETEKIQSTHVEAASIAGKITRKHTKRNTMTVPYSVSKRGMSQQIWDFMDEDKLAGTIWWKGDPWIVNKLLTDLNYTCIYDTIPGAKIGQDYLVDLAKLNNDAGEGMKFYTPMYSIPVVQKKPRVKVQRVRTPLGALSLRSDIPHSLDKMSQKNGSAPNFIHAMDSTLLLYTIENMNSSIGVIHDCFLSHPNDGFILQEVFKEGYIKLMKQRPLELLGKQLDPEGVIDIPYIGTLNLDDVIHSKYIIS